MNFLKVFSVAVLFSGVSQVKAQEDFIFKTHDNPAKCQNIKNGTFLRAGYEKKHWYMTIKDNVQTEYYNDGKDFIKAMAVFIDDCNYKLIITEKSDKSAPMNVGDVFNNKILETQQDFIRIFTDYNGKQFDQVLIKEKEAKKAEKK